MDQKRPVIKSIVVLIIALVLLLVGSGYIFYLHEKKTIRRETYLLLKTIAQLKSDQILQWRNDLLSNAYLHSTGILKKEIIKWLTNPDLTPNSQILSRLQEIRDNKNYENIILVGADGRILLSADPSRTALEPEALPLLNLVLDRSMPVIGDFFIIPSQNGIHIDTAAPVLDPHNNLFAVLILRTNPLSHPYPLIQAWPLTNASAETLLVRKEDDHALFPTETLHQTGTALIARVSLSSTQIPAVQAVLGRTGMVEGINAGGKKVLADIRPVPGTLWFLVTSMDISKVYAPLKEKQKILIALISVLSLLIGVSLVLAWRHQRSRYYREKYKEAEALRENETRFEEMFLKHMAVMLLIDPQSGAILDANPAAERFYGYPLSRLRTMHIAEINMLSPDEIARERQRALQRQRQYFIFPHRLADGQTRIVEVYSSPFWFKNQPVLFSIIHDITERKQAHDALMESELRFKTQYQSNPVPIFTWQKKGGDFELINFNQSAETVTAGKALRLLGSKASVLYADRQEIFQDLQQCFVEKKPVKRELRSGHFVPGKLIAVTMAFVPPDLVMVHMEDITERRQAEEALRESEEKYRRIVELAQEGIWVINAQINTVYVNPRMAEILGYTVEEMLGRSLFSFLNEEGVTSMKKHIELRKKGIDEKYEHEYIRKDGRQVQTIVSTASIMDSRGIFLGAIAVLTDITERMSMEEENRKLEAKMQQIQKLESLGILAGGIAHDFNNMLMVMLGNADLALMADHSGVSAARPMLSEIKKVALRASDLCKQMLAYAGKGPFSIQSVHLSRLVEEMGHMLEISVSKKTLLHYELSKQLPAIQADAAQIRQVVMNLIINASEAIGDQGGIITIRTGSMKCDKADLKAYQAVDELEEGLFVFLEVVDTGCGMDPATLNRIFDPFFSTKFVGRGLGLSAVLGIVRGHKGALRIESALERGSLFRVLFPAQETATEVAEPEENGKKGWKGSGLVLLVDDDESIRSVGCHLLKHLGFEVLTACNGREALEIFQKHGNGIRCVILDLTMPVMDGGETFAALHRLNPGTRVIMTSGYNEQTLIGGFFEQGLAGFIQKPYQLMELTAVLKSVLEESAT